MGQPQLNTLELREELLEYVLEAHFPGMSANDLALDVEGDLLTLRGVKRFHHEEGGVEQREESAVTFARSIQLPVDVETSGIMADFGDGTLEVHIPKVGTPQDYLTPREKRVDSEYASPETDEDAADRSWSPTILGRLED